MTEDLNPNKGVNQNVRQCTQCHQALLKVGKFWICPEHGQLPEPKPFTPLRIFLSYGHDRNEELVHKIKSDLEKRGHDVWFDKNDIQFGDDWRRSITEGITKSNQVVSFLSKHSTRDPGVCLDELAIAIGIKGGNIQTILLENETEVKPPPSISHIQWLDMQDWKERRAIGDAEWDTWYKDKLAEIIRVVESESSVRFAGEIDKLKVFLNPISSDTRISDLLKKGFVGRTWVSDAIEHWRIAENRESRLFWIMGNPGVGKSAFAAHLTHFGRDKIIAAQFVEWNKQDHRSAVRVIRSIAFQLATRLPDYRKLLLTLPEIGKLDQKDATELFAYLLTNPLQNVINGGRERYLIVIDALDEAVENGRNQLVELLASDAKRLPHWIGLVITSRPESAVTTRLKGLNPFVLDTAGKANSTDICEYLRHQLASLLAVRMDANHLIEKVLEKSEGVFLYVESICNDILQGNLSLDRLNEFPQGLGGIFCQFFDRQFPNKAIFEQTIEPALGAIIAAREPLPVEVLQHLFNWREPELQKWLRTLGSLFPATAEEGCEVIKPYHKSLTDWLTDTETAGEYFVSVMDGHRLLAKCGWQDYQNCVQTMKRYFLINLSSHLAVLARRKDLINLILDPAFIRYKCYNATYANLYDDYQLLLNANQLDSKIMKFSSDLRYLQDLCFSKPTELELELLLINILANRIKSIAFFFGREQATKTVEEAIQKHNKVLIIGGPASGKTFFLTHISVLNYRRVVYHHVCRAIEQNSLSQRSFIIGLSIGLCQYIPDYFDRLKSYSIEFWNDLELTDNNSLFDILVLRLLHNIRPPSINFIITVDALDETINSSSFIDFISSIMLKLPSWLRIIATSRPSQEVLEKLTNWSVTDFDIATYNEVGRYLAHRLRSSELATIIENDESNIATIIEERANGNIFYAKSILDQIEQGTLTPKDYLQLPHDLKSIFLSQFLYMFPDIDVYINEYLPLFKILIASEEAVSLADIVSVLGDDSQAITNRLVFIRPILLVSNDITKNERFALFHRSLSSWLCDPNQSKKYCVRPNT